MVCSTNYWWPNLAGSSPQTNAQGRLLLLATCTFPANQGTQISLLAMWRALAERGVAITMLSFGQGPAVRVGDGVHRSCPWPKVGRRSGLSLARCGADLALLVAAWQTCRHQPITALLVHSLEGLAIARLVQLWSAVPIIYQRHTDMGAELPSYFRQRWLAKLSGQLGRWAETWLTRQAQLVIDFGSLCQLPSQSFSQLRSRTGRAPLQARMRPYIDGDRLWQAMKTNKRSRVRQLRQAGPWVLYAGNSDGYQQLEYLQQAWPLVLAQQPSARLLLASFHRPKGAAGFGELLALPNCRAIQLRTVQQLALWLQVAKVGVAPRQLTVGFPVKTITYLLADLPCVAYEAGTQVLDSLPMGLIRIPGGVQALAQGILQGLHDTRPVGQIRRATAAWLANGQEPWLAWLAQQELLGIELQQGAA